MHTNNRRMVFSQIFEHVTTTNVRDKNVLYDVVLLVVVQIPKLFNIRFSENLTQGFDIRMVGADL